MCDRKNADKIFIFNIYNSSEARGIYWLAAGIVSLCSPYCFGAKIQMENNIGCHVAVLRFCICMHFTLLLASPTVVCVYCCLLCLHMLAQLFWCSKCLKSVSFEANKIRSIVRLMLCGVLLHAPVKHNAILWFQIFYNSNGTSCALCRYVVCVCVWELVWEWECLQLLRLLLVVTYYYQFYLLLHTFCGASHCTWNTFYRPNTLSCCWW